MNKQEILNAVKELSRSQGYYVRLYEFLLNDGKDTLLNEMEKQKFKDVVDMIMWLEE